MTSFLIPYLIFFAYVVSYPVQVFTLGRVSGVFGVVLLASFSLMLLHVVNSEKKLAIRKYNFYVLLLLATLPLSYSIAYLTNPSEYFAATFGKTAVLFLVAFFLASSRMVTLFNPRRLAGEVLSFQPRLIASWVLFGGPLITMLVAAIMNSKGAIPTGAILDDKYYYGSFIRAGGGYVDPNVLGVMIILTVSLMLEYIARYRSLLIFSVITLLVISLLTFSRTAQILFFAFCLFRIKNQFSKNGALLVVIAAAGLCGFFLFFSLQSISLFFQRFFNEEGGSSLNDRFNQFQVFFDIISSADLKSIMFGFGGQEAFQEAAGSAMHSAPFSVALDVGVFSGLSVLAFFAVTSVRLFWISGGWFLITAIAASFVLPYIPELFFLLFIYLIVDDEIFRSSINQRSKKI